MNCFYTKQELYSTVDCIRTDLLLETEKNIFPIPLFSVCQQIDDLAIEAVPFQTESLRGMAMIAENIKQNDVILLNSRLDASELNFYCAHELMHICLHREKSGRQFNCYDKLMPNQDPALEWQANEGGAELLMPYRSLLPKIKKAYPLLVSWQDVRNFRSELSSYYRVSPVVVKLRLESLKYEIHQFLNGCALEDIQILSHRQQKQQQISLKSLIELEDELYSRYLEESVLQSGELPEISSARPQEPETAQDKTFEKAEQEWLYGFL